MANFVENLLKGVGDSGNWQDVTRGIYLFFAEHLMSRATALRDWLCSQQAANLFLHRAGKKMLRSGQQETYLESPPVAKKLIQTRRNTGTRRPVKYCVVVLLGFFCLGFNTLFAEIK